MKTTLFLLFTVLLIPSLSSAAGPPSAKEQIAATLLAAPEDRRAEAAVLGYDRQGALVTLREGTNDLICLADDPKKEKFSAACYHKDLEPFMARGRELIAQGITGQKRNDIRWKEVGDGTLAMSRAPRALYVLSGAAYDAAADKVTEPYLRWVIYVPYATPESTGLSTERTPGGPWLMGSGTAGAHIMINPPRVKK
jgi:hypothetical protein